MPQSGLRNEGAVQAENAVVEGSVYKPRLRPPCPVNGHSQTQCALQQVKMVL